MTRARLTAPTDVASDRLPAHVMRSGPAAQRSDERLEVERVLAEARVELTAREVASRAGVTVAKASNVIGHMIASREAHKVSDSPSTYRIGPPPTPVLQAPRAPVWSSSTADVRVGAARHPAPVRAGALDAFTLPSLQSGQRVERVAPRILSTAVPEGTRHKPR